MLRGRGGRVGRELRRGGEQIEVLSPSQFVVKYVHREQGGCTYTASITYELSGQSKSACEQVIEVPEEEQQQPISTPPPLPPIEDDAPYTVALPVMPADARQITNRRRTSKRRKSSWMTPPERCSSTMARAAIRLTKTSRHNV